MRRAWRNSENATQDFGLRPRYDFPVNYMRRVSLPAFLSALLLSTVGCIDMEEEYTLNPDGSGKVVVRWVGAPLDFNNEKTAEARAASILRDEVTKSEGIDAWKDVSCAARDDGKFEFKGTAYFKDFAQVKLHYSGLSSPRLKCSKDARGNLVVGTEVKKTGDPGKPVSDEEAKKELKEQRVKYQQGKRVIETMLADLKSTTTVNLPGRVGETTNFKKTGDASVRIALDGKAFLKAIDDLIMNDEWMLRNIKAHGTIENPAMNDDALYEKIFGEKGPIRAVTTGELKPLFNYEGEAGPARKAWTEAAAKIGIAAAGPAAKGGDFKSLKIAGIRYVFEHDSERNPGSPGSGVTLTLYGDLPGAVLSVKQGLLNKAVADTGEDLLPDKFQRTIHFPHLSQDKAGVSFDVNLKLPSAAAKGFKEVSGVLTYFVGGTTKEVDLGFDELKADAQGKGAEIKKIEDSKWEEGSQDLDVRIEMPSDTIKSVVVKDASGAVLKTTEGGSWNSDRETTRILRLKGKFPAKGKIVAIVYDDLKSFEIPFKIENVDLLGRPLK